MYDILMKNGLVVDGTGRPAYTADVAVKDGKIAKIAPDILDAAEEIIDTAGLVVAPGFIDCHNHSDNYVFVGSDAYNYLEQGVTTQICGNCGETPVPYYSGTLGWLKDAQERQRCAEIAATPASFMDGAKNASFGVNMALFLGHGAVRGNVMGYDPAEPNEKQLEAMCDWVRQAMECGYLGYSSGLIYAPSAYAQTPELIRLAKAMAPYGGIYASHIRNEGDGVVAAVEEAIRIGEEAGVQVQISHLKVMGKHNEGLSEKLLELIENANARGVRVFADQYPYEASAASLRSRIPSQYHEGGISALLERLKDPAVRQEIDQAVFGVEGCVSGVSPIASEDILISGLKTNPEYVGMTLAQVARQTGRSAVDALCDLLIQNAGRGQGIYYNQSRSDIHRILASKWVFGSSDSSNLPDQRMDPDTRFGSHPRRTGALVRRLQLQRELNLMSMEEAIHRVTGGPAAALGLRDQGILREGAPANVTVMDYKNLRAHSSFEYPHRKNEGICFVLVNGTVAVRNGCCTGSRTGKLIQKNG